MNDSSATTEMMRHGDPAQRSSTARGRRRSTPTAFVVATPDDSPAFICATAGWIGDGDYSDDFDGDYDAYHDVMQATQLPAPHVSDDQDDDEASVFDNVEDEDDDDDEHDRRAPFAADRQRSVTRSYERASVDMSHCDDVEEDEEGLSAVSRSSRLCHAPVETWIDRRMPLGRGFSEPPLMTLD